MSQVDAPDLVAPELPQTPAKSSTIDVADESAPLASRSQKDLSPRRIVLTRPKRVAPMPGTIQSSPIDTFSPVASSTPARPPPGKVVDESPLLGKRRHDEPDASPAKPNKPKSKGKRKAVDLSPEHSSPIESPRFDTPIPGRRSKRPRESGRSPSPIPKRKPLRTGVVPTSPINSAEFPPNTKLPPLLGRQASVTASSDQLFMKPQDNRVIKIKSKMPPPAEASVADTSLIESFDTSPPKPLTTVKQADLGGIEKKPKVPLQAAVSETSFLTSPWNSSPEKQSTSLPPPPLLENSRENPASNSDGVAELSNFPLPGQKTKTIGITKLRPAATTILPSEAGPSKNTSSTMPLRSRSTLGPVQKKKSPMIPTKKGKEKPAKMTPVEYAEMLIEKYNNPNRRIPNVSQHLRGRKIFYAGVDMRYAGDATKKKMEYVRINSARTLTPLAHSPVLDSKARGHACPQI